LASPKVFLVPQMAHTTDHRFAIVIPNRYSDYAT